MFRRMTSLLVADEAFSVSNMLCSFIRREIDLVYVHGVRVGSGGSPSRWDIAVSSSSEFPELYHVLVEFPSLVKPLFPLPTSLSVREGSGSHHDSKLLGYPSLEGIHQDAIIINSAVCLGQFEGGGVFVEVSIELVHVKGVDSLAGSVFKILWDKGLFKSLA